MWQGGGLVTGRKGRAQLSVLPGSSSGRWPAIGSMLKVGNSEPSNPRVETTDGVHGYLCAAFDVGPTWPTATCRAAKSLRERLSYFNQKPKEIVLPSAAAGQGGNWKTRLRLLPDHWSWTGSNFKLVDAARAGWTAAHRPSCFETGLRPSFFLTVTSAGTIPDCLHLSSDADVAPTALIAGQKVPMISWARHTILGQPPGCAATWPPVLRRRRLQLVSLPRTRRRRYADLKVIVCQPHRDAKQAGLLQGYDRGRIQEPRNF